MSVGQVGSDGDSEAEGRPFAGVLAADEEVRLSWSATGVHWAHEWRSAPERTTFAATDRRIVFGAEDAPTSIGYDHVRAVETDSASTGPGLSTAFLGCGGVCLLVGLLVATSDLANGVGLVVLSVALLVAGSAVDDATESATITLVIDNERQRLSFEADEEVGVRLAELVEDHG
jgi:hypothetical protein